MCKRRVTALGGEEWKGEKRQKASSEKRKQRIKNNIMDLFFGKNQ
jgi:hypothetical protein